MLLAFGGILPATAAVSFPGPIPQVTYSVGLTWNSAQYCQAEAGQRVGISLSKYANPSTVPAQLARLAASTSARIEVSIPAGVSTVGISAESGFWGDTVMGVAYDQGTPPGHQSDYLGWEYALFPNANASTLISGVQNGTLPSNRDFYKKSYAWLMNFNNHDVEVYSLNVVATISDPTLFKQWLFAVVGIDCGGVTTPSQEVNLSGIKTTSSNGKLKVAMRFTPIQQSNRTVKVAIGIEYTLNGRVNSIIQTADILNFSTHTEMLISDGEFTESQLTDMKVRIFGAYLFSNSDVFMFVNPAFDCSYGGCMGTNVNNVVPFGR